MRRRTARKMAVTEATVMRRNWPLASEVCYAMLKRLLKSRMMSHVVLKDEVLSWDCCSQLWSFFVMLLPKLKQKSFNEPVWVHSAHYLTTIPKVLGWATALRMNQTLSLMQKMSLFSQGVVCQRCNVYLNVSTHGIILLTGHLTKMQIDMELHMHGMFYLKIMSRSFWDELQDK